MDAAESPSGGLREACVATARALIAEKGIEQLSLRDVARRLGVSHQAPYKHYPSRDHLLAEVIRRCFQDLAAALSARERFDDPVQDLRSLGRQYLSYSLTHPLEYRLMFGTPWPAATADQPDLLRDARLSFDVLRQALAPVYGGRLPPQQLDLNALFVWASMHGVTSLLHSNAMEHLGLPEPVLASAVEHAMDLVDAALASAVARAS
jgi:AcrR family transcriptional regulator